MLLRPRDRRRDKHPFALEAVTVSVTSASRIVHFVRCETSASVRTRVKWLSFPLFFHCLRKLTSHQFVSGRGGVYRSHCDSPFERMRHSSSVVIELAREWDEKYEGAKTERESQTPHSPPSGFPVQGPCTFSQRRQVTDFSSTTHRLPPSMKTIRKTQLLRDMPASKHEGFF